MNLALIKLRAYSTPTVRFNLVSFASCSQCFTSASCCLTVNGPPTKKQLAQLPLPLALAEFSETSSTMSAERWRLPIIRAPQSLSWYLLTFWVIYIYIDIAKCIGNGTCICIYGHPSVYRYTRVACICVYIYIHMYVYIINICTNINI